MPEVVNGAGINEVDSHVKKSRSKFPLNELFLDTHRFGEYHPHFVLDGVSSDKHPFRSIHDARSYTLKAPLMQDIQLHKDYFMVTLRSILPLQSERIVTNPNMGDDVPSDAYTSVPDFISKISAFITSFDTYISDTNVSDYQRCTALFQKCVLLEAVFSRGSLLASLGCNLSACVKCFNSGNSTLLDVDGYIDHLCSLIASYISANTLYVFIDGIQYEIVTDSSVDDFRGFGVSHPVITIHDFMQYIRDTSDWYFESTSLGSLATVLLSDFGNFTITYNTTAGFPIDLARLWAYHLACAEYFTDDHIDYIYSAEIFRQYIFYLCRTGLGTSGFMFNWNGLNLPYDYLSARYFVIFTNSSWSTYTAVQKLASLQYFLTLFGYKRSLRFKDYFTGSRTRPLALVTNSNYNTDVSVNANKVSVIDVTRSIQVQRFLNAVNASGRKFGEYIDSLFGVRPNKDMHEPIYLAHSSDSLFASQIENTGAGQLSQPNSITAIFRGNSNNFEYTVSVDEPCIIIGVTSYDIERCYSDIIQRSFFTRDRFDMFLPQMQYIGDQPVYQHELSSGYTGVFGTAFGYQFRDMQYKQMINRCAGAFNSYMLPGFAFIYNQPSLYNNQNISPDFIRSRNSELDKFYLQLSTYSLGNYFHFILRQTNVDDASRPMTAQPQIL